MEQIIVHGTAIQLDQGDITREETEAIVNAANSGQIGGGGVDGAIHRAGGPSIMAQCRKIGGCPTGSAVMTSAGNLKAKHVIHAVGPIYQGGTQGEAELLKSAFWRCLKIAEEHNLSSISFPAISAGIYGYPLDEAACIALTTAIEFAETAEQPELIRFILFDGRTYQAFSKALNSAEKQNYQ